MPITTCVFDAYGTLFDVNAAARRAAAEPGAAHLAEVWPALARGIGPGGDAEAGWTSICHSLFACVDFRFVD